MKKLYKFFSLGAHPNRDLIPRRFLGEGNEFVLGSVCVPSLVLVSEYCTIHLRMWFWFTAMLLHHYQHLVDAAKPDFGTRYLHVADRAQKLQAEFDRNYDRLLREEQSRHKPPVLLTLSSLLLNLHPERICRASRFNENGVSLR